MITDYNDLTGNCSIEFGIFLDLTNCVLNSTGNYQIDFCSTFSFVCFNYVIDKLFQTVGQQV